MAGILDYLTGNDAAASPWGMLYGSPLLPNGAPQPATPDLAAAYGALGLDPTALRGQNLPAPDPFGDPSRYSVADPNAPAPQAPAPNPFVGGGATPFSFAGPGSMNVNPAQMAAPAPMAAPQAPQQPAPQAAPAAPEVASDPAAPIAVGGNYQMPRIGSADDFEPDDETPANAKPTQGAIPTAAPAAPAPFSLAGAGDAVGDRLMKATRGFMGNLALGPIGALMGGAGALITGRNTDPTSIATEKSTATAQALVGKGAPVADVQAAVNNPALMQALINQYYGKDKYKVQQTGEDGMGRKTFQLFNEADGTFKPIPNQAGGAAGADAGIGDMTKKGAEYLATVPPAQRNTIQMMLSGDLPPPTSFAMAKPYWQNMIAAARNVDPNFTETNWAGRVAMARSAQGDGKMGQNNNAIVTGIGHLMQLRDAIDGLGNSNYSQTYNGIKNAVSTEFGGTGATNFRAVANRVAPEIVKIWRGTGGAEADIKRDIESLNTSQTPDQLRGAIGNIAGMMRSKLEANQQEYKATMGRDLPMTPEQQKILSLLDQMSAGGGGSAQPGAAPLSSGKTSNGVQWSVH